VIDAMVERPDRFDFHRAVAILERAAELVRERGDREPRRKGDGWVALTGVRIRSMQSVDFPVSDIARIEWPDDVPAGGSAVVHVAFAGLTGPGGFLPDFYTFELRRREFALDMALGDLFAIVENRMLTHLQRAWESRRPAALFERASLPSVRRDPTRLDRQSAHRLLVALLGIDPTVFRQRGELHSGDEIDDVIPFAARLANRRRPTVVVERIMMELLGVPVTLIQFRGRWLDVDVDELRDLGGGGLRLGTTTMLGQRIWDIQSCIRLRVGPVDAALYHRLLPGGDVHRRLARLSRFLVGPEIEIELQPVLHAAEVPIGMLGRPPRTAGDSVPIPVPATRLGRNAFLESADRTTDFDEAQFPLRVDQEPNLDQNPHHSIPSEAASP